VLGTQVGGTVAGALLAKRGYRVLQIDCEGQGASYSNQGYLLPYNPAMLPSPKHMPAAETVLTELGIAADLARTFDAVASDVQLLYPRHRLELSRDANRLSEELSREFGPDCERLLASLSSTAAESDRTDAFFRAPPPLPPEGFFERRAVRKAAAACAPVREQDTVLCALDDHPLGSALRALTRFLVHLDDAGATGVARTRPLSQLLRGAHRFPGGTPGLRDVLRQRMEELGADCVGGARDPTVVEELSFEGSRLCGVKLASGPGVIRAAIVLAAMDIRGVAHLVPPKAKRGRLSQLFESVRARSSLLTLNLVVRAEGVPVGLGELALLLPDDDALGPVLLEVLAAKRAGGDGGPAAKILCAAAFVPARDEDAGEDRLRALLQGLEERVRSIAPFLDRHLLARSCPRLDARNTRSDRSLAHPHLEIAFEPTLGITGLPQRTGCKNLFLTSREVLPGLGLEGEFIAGQRAAAMVQEVLKKHDPLK
jgi:phytoene dehydrogenase-like protein